MLSLSQPVRPAGKRLVLLLNGPRCAGLDANLQKFVVALREVPPPFLCSSQIAESRTGAGFVVKKASLDELKGPDCIF
jgi:hypothetical protein